MRGRVKFLKLEAGYGFVTPADPQPDGRDIFLHASAVPPNVWADLAPGDRLEFDLMPGRDGKTKAGNVRVIEH